MNTFKKALVLLVLTGVFFACKKDNELQPDEQEITAAEVTTYYIVMEFSPEVASTLGVAYFTLSEYNDLMVSILYKSGVGVASAFLDQDILSFEGFGDSDFAFTLKRDDGGDLLLENVAYSDPDRSDDRIVHAQLHKVSDMPGFENKVFQQTDNPNSYLKFAGEGGTGEWWWHAAPDFSGATATPYRKLGAGSVWERTGSAVPYHLGVVVPYWKGTNGPFMLVQNTANRKTIVVFKPYL